MIAKKPKALTDFVSFTVASVRRGPTSEAGYTTFELDGRFSQIIDFDSDWFWLLVGEKNCITVRLNSLDKQSGTATVVATEKESEMPDVLGKTLFYLSLYWQAFNIWMVLDADWGWQRVQFQKVDAIAERHESHEVSIVDGREVRKWVKLERADRQGHISRYYPAEDHSDAAETPSQIIPHGWDHENCTLCNEHINAGIFGYRDSDGRWMCEPCYEKYAKPHDLSFVDEL